MIDALIAGIGESVTIKSLTASGVGNADGMGGHDLPYTAGTAVDVIFFDSFRSHATKERVVGGVMTVISDAAMYCLASVTITEKDIVVRASGQEYDVISVVDACSLGEFLEVELKQRKRSS